MIRETTQKSASPISTNILRRFTQINNHKLSFSKRTHSKKDEQISPKESREHKLFKSQQEKRLKREDNLLKELKGKENKDKTPEQMMMEYNMVPSHDYENKQVNLYRSTVQVKKHMIFGENTQNSILLDDSIMDDRFELFFNSSKEDDPWIRSRDCFKERNAKILEKWEDHRKNLCSWKPISDLLMKTDEETFQYVLRCLCRRIGNDKFLIKPRIKPKEKPEEIKFEKDVNVTKKLIAGIQKRLSTAIKAKNVQLKRSSNQHKNPFLGMLQKSNT